MKRSIIFGFFIIYLTSCFAQQINYEDCTDSDPKGLCKINRVEITPCKEAGSKKACSLKKGKTYNLKMDFTALGAMDIMKSTPYWAAPTGDLSFPGMNEDACTFTQCPIAQNAEQTYDFQLKIAKSLPRGQFDVKWKFWGSNDTSSTEGCCARIYLRLL